jgi:hypothetical protein
MSIRNNNNYNHNNQIEGVKSLEGIQGAPTETADRGVIIVLRSSSKVR